MAKKGKKKPNYFQAHPNKKPFKLAPRPGLREYIEWLDEFAVKGKKAVESLGKVGEALEELVTKVLKIEEAKIYDQHDPGDEQPRQTLKVDYYVWR